ncbi:hypothetical protein C426_1765 [Lactococcus garvieae DCC43]|jgi:hypothetical protein|uniref:Uncharacterized protein n=1 Tax=Lactococcus garvieae DCC43 TaxID=1231377 RepID=K2PHC7_9LACT|nr:hypothetical protein C426_1765 [Lactococcus garvieae DCC43]
MLGMDTTFEYSQKVSVPVIKKPGSLPGFFFFEFKSFLVYQIIKASHSVTPSRALSFL